MEGVMVDKDISISNLIYFMKTMLSEVFKKDIKVRLRPGFSHSLNRVLNSTSAVLSVAARVVRHVSTAVGLSYAPAV